MSCSKIFGRPGKIEEEFESNPLLIYPVRLADYDRFTELSAFLYVDEEVLPENNLDFTLLKVVVLGHDAFKVTFEDMLKNMADLFSIVTRQPVGFKFENDNIIFFTGEGGLISEYNYGSVRKIITEQNLMFSPKQYKDPEVAEWANRILKNRQKKSKIKMEDIISTVSLCFKMTYEEIEKLTLYQLYANFYRACKLLDYETSVILASAGASDITMQHFAENIDVADEANPYKDLFVSGTFITELGKALA